MSMGLLYAAAFHCRSIFRFPARCAAPANHTAINIASRHNLLCRTLSDNTLLIGRYYQDFKVYATLFAEDVSSYCIQIYALKILVVSATECKVC